MTFNEWCAQTAKELGTGYTCEIITRVMIMAIRVALEELGANPKYANLTIGNLGRFYLNHSAFHYNTQCQGLRTNKNYNHSEDLVYTWTIKFKPSKKLKDVINARTSMIDYVIGGYPLYPEFIAPEDYEKKNVILLKKVEVRHPNEYWIKKINLMKMGVLDFVNNEWVKTGFTVEDYEKKEIDKKRGRPCNKMTINQIRTAVMTELKRDYKREVRQLKKGEITEKELRFPWYSSPQKDTKKFQDELVSKFFPNSNKTVKKKNVRKNKSDLGDDNG